MLISPAERDPQLLTLGVVSSVPERYGADFLIFSPVFGRVGVQRKTVADLIASARDGRLQKEVAQLQTIDVGMFIIEGRPQWTTDGALVSNYTGNGWTLAQHIGTTLSLCANGFWTFSTDSLQDTYVLLSTLARWLAKERHVSLKRRPNPKSAWGTADSFDWKVHVMQGFPGIGYENARKIVEKFGLPFALKEDVMLQSVDGIGPGLERKIMEALGQ